MLGYEVEELTGRPWHDTVHHTCLDGTPYPVEDCPIHAALRDGAVHRETDEVFWRKDGTSFPIECVSTPIWDVGEVIGIVGTFSDITERKRAEEELRLWDRAISESSNAIIITDPNRTDNPVVYVNPAFEQDTGYTAEEAIGRNCRFLQGSDRDQPGIDELRAAVRERRECQTVVRNYRKDGSVFWNEINIYPVHDEEGRLTNYVGVQNDITERKALEEQLVHQALHDPLTGLPNRTLFMDRLGNALARADRHGDSVAVLYIDIDDFKVINDSLRHEVGDRLLVAVAKRLRSCLRPMDTAARFGGDEFAILIESARAEEATWVAERILEKLRAPFNIDGHVLFVSASIGVAPSDPAREDPGDLLRAADIAMYRAKAKSKAHYEVFDPGKDAPALERLWLESGLRRAVERGELRICYQPIVRLETGKVAGMEALVHWEHLERGVISPAEFIPLAEATGLIVPIGRWVLEEACRHACEWQERYQGDDYPLVVGVNLSLRQFQHPELVKDVAKILQETGLDPSSLALEITESVAMEDAETTVTILKEFKALGVWLVIDDFGTGKSSLSYLTRRFSMDYLKIDGSFVRELVEDPENSMVVLGLINFAHILGLRVIAEGVETAGQLRQLKEMGCDMVQGYHLAKPLPSAAVPGFLAIGHERRYG